MLFGGKTALCVHKAIKPNIGFAWQFQSSLQAHKTSSKFDCSQCYCFIIFDAATPTVVFDIAVVIANARARASATATCYIDL